MKKLLLKKIDLSDLGFGEVLSSVDREDINCLLSSQCLVLRDFTCPIEGSFKDFLRSPSFLDPIVERIWKNFCTGTYWFFGSVILQMESGNPLFSEEDSLQFLAILVTLLDPQSQPVVLYQVEKLV